MVMRLIAASCIGNQLSDLYVIRLRTGKSRREFGVEGAGGAFDEFTYLLLGGSPL